MQHLAAITAANYQATKDAVADFERKRKAEAEARAKEREARREQTFDVPHSDVEVAVDANGVTIAKDLGPWEGDVIFLTWDQWRHILATIEAQRYHG